MVINLSKTRIIKFTAVLLSLLMIWQGVVWASADIFKRNDLQPRTLISDPEGAHAAAVAYLTGLLARYESDPDNRNLFRIEPCVRKAIAELKASDKFLDRLPVIKGLPESGEIIIDLGPCAIRYYNHKLPASTEPDEAYRVVEEKRISDYLSRQIITREGAREQKRPAEADEEKERSPREKESEKTQNRTEKDTGKDTGFSALGFIGKKLSMAYSPFFHAPTLEELFKVGLPFAVLGILNKIDHGIPFLNTGVFYGLLVVLGTLFTAAHTFNRNRARQSTPQMGDLLRIFAAPLLTAAGGMVLAILYAGTPSLAIALSAGWHLFVNLGVALVRKFKIDAGYASLDDAQRKEIIEVILERAEETDYVIGEYDSIKRDLYRRFRIDLDSDEFAYARLRIAMMSAVQAPRKTMAGFKRFNLDAARYPEEIKDIAEVCAGLLTECVVTEFRNLGFDPERDEDVIREIAEVCAAKDGENTARYFRNFGLKERNHVVSVATLCAMQDGYGTAVYFDQFGLDPARGKEEAGAVMDIAITAAKEGASGVSANFRNFKFNPERHKAFIFNIAMECAMNNGRATALNFPRFGLTQRDDIVLIAKLCAQEDLDGTLLYFKRFGLGMEKEEALQLCREAEREFISESASGFLNIPVYRSLGENGKMFLRMVDEAYDTLDLSGLSIGAQAYIKLLLIEEVTTKEVISGDFVKKVNEEIVPALTALETLTMEYPTFGLDYYRPSGEMIVGEGQDVMLCIKIMNYISRTRTPHDLDRSVLSPNGERFIRVPPAPYPVMGLLVSKLEELHIADMRDFNISAAGEHMEEGLFLFSLLYFAGSRPAGRTSNGEVPGKPWIRSGRQGLTIDPWTGKFVKEDDPRTKGTQTQFFLVGSNAPLERKLLMAFALVSASAAYKGAYGLEDEELGKIYGDLKKDVRSFYEDRLGIGRLAMGRLEEVSFRELINYYSFNTGLAGTVLEAIDAHLRDNPQETDVSRITKRRLYGEYREMVDGYIERIMAHVFKGGMAELLDKGLSGEFGDIKQTVLSMCFSDPETTGQALKVAERAYPVEYDKIQKVGKKVKRSRPSGIKEILKNAGKVVGKLVNSLFGFSEKGKKVLIALDLEIGEGQVNALLRGIAEALPGLEGNNEDLKRFFKDLEIIKGEGRVLAQRVANLTDPDRGSVDPENLIVITKKDNIPLYGRFEGRATVAGIDDEGFPDTAYLPLLEVVLFAIGRHLGWDRGTLIKYYETIPNVISYKELAVEDRGLLFSKERVNLVIRLIPDAQRFGTQELRILMENIKTMLARA